VDALNRAIPAGVLRLADLERAAWTIARKDYTAPDFIEVLTRGLTPWSNLTDLEVDAIRYLLAFDGWALDGSTEASLYLQTIIALREELFTRHVGSLLAPETFRQAIQPSVILNALEGKTKFDYLAGRTASQVVLSAFKKAVDRLASVRGQDPALWGYRPASILYEGEPPIPYGDRGTYIQVVEARPTIRGRNVLPPGVAETGPHSRDQAPLARAWSYKAMRIR
jgi:penicillin amidase